jgi:succinyl-CoA synthetase alpha subunit
MSLLLPATPTVLVQGITGRFGHYFAKIMLDYGTNIVGGVTPGKGGAWFHGKPVFDTMKRAVESTGANVSLIAVPPENASDAMFEAIDAGIRAVICITENMPKHDIMRALHYARQHKVTVYGPASAGICLPELALIGMIPPYVVKRGNVGVVGKSGTLLYQIAYMLTKIGIGQSAVVSIGSGALVGTSLVDVLEAFESDGNTERVVVLGEIGGREEYSVAQYVLNEMSKPVIGMVVGQRLPNGMRFGHGGAIATGFGTSAEEKIAEWRKVGIRVAGMPEEVPKLLTELD